MPLEPIGEGCLTIFFEIILGGIFRMILNFFRLIGGFVQSLFTGFQKPITHYYKKGEESSKPYLIGFLVVFAISTYLSLN